MVRNDSVGLKAGDVVEVRSVEDIAATLDDRGELESLPFMPEMLPFCGRRMTVYKVANKVCDLIGSSGIRRMERTVLLRGSRCNGSGHGGCQNSCLLFWKEAWLTRIGEDVNPSLPPSGPLFDRELLPLLETATRLPPDHDGVARYACQATEMLRATPGPLPLRALGQYVDDVRYGNVGPLASVSAFLVRLYNRFQDASTAHLPAWLRARGGRRWSEPEGRLNGRTPTGALGLQPGDLVRIKSREDIERTLNRGLLNRGMKFDEEMTRECGREARVLRRVERVIDEKSGRMLEMKSPCIVLDNVWCEGVYHSNCPRSYYSFWREIWLDRVGEPAPATDPAHSEEVRRLGRTGAR